MTDKLPAGVAAAWGLSERQGGRRRTGLSRERIVAAAIEVADADGITAVSMPRLAKELGTAPMSLYRHISGKQELLALMRDTALGTITPPPEGGWRERLTHCAREILDAYRRHPWGLYIPISGLPVMPHELAWVETALASLSGSGLAPGEKMSVLVLVSGYVRAHGLMATEVDAAFRTAPDGADAFISDYTALLKRLTGPESFPALTEVLASGVLDQADPPDEEFAFGLDRILDGVEALILARR